MSTEDANRIVLLQGTLDLLILQTLRLGPAHGHAIMQGIKQRSEDVLLVEQGSLYPALRRMEETGWLRAEWIEREAGRRARVYEITALGRKQLAVEESRWQTSTAAVNQVLRMA